MNHPTKPKIGYGFVTEPKSNKSNTFEKWFNKTHGSPPMQESSVRQLFNDEFFIWTAALQSIQSDIKEFPDETGWWWFYDKNRYGWECREVSNLAGQLQWWGIDEYDELGFLECEKGKWIKIPTPHDLKDKK